jgi:hypothetical protein
VEHDIHGYGLLDLGLMLVEFTDHLPVFVCYLSIPAANHSFRGYVLSEPFPIRYDAIHGSIVPAAFDAGFIFWHIQDSHESAAIYVEPIQIYVLDILHALNLTQMADVSIRDWVLV